MPRSLSNINLLINLITQLILRKKICPTAIHLADVHETTRRVNNWIIHSIYLLYTLVRAAFIPQGNFFIYQKDKKHERDCGNALKELSTHFKRKFSLSLLEHVI